MYACAQGGQDNGMPGTELRRLLLCRCWEWKPVLLGIAQLQFEGILIFGLVHKI